METKNNFKKGLEKRLNIIKKNIIRSKKNTDIYLISNFCYE